MNARFFALLSLITLVGCRGRADTESAAPGASQSAATQASATPSQRAAPAAEKPWFEGAWHGAYKSELQRIEGPGGVKQWATDSGERGSGEGQRTLTAAADGLVTGSAEGPLGAQSLLGRFEAESLAFTLTPREDSGFSGVAAAARKDATLHGTFAASTGDSLLVRKGSLVLKRLAP